MGQKKKSFAKSPPPKPSVLTAGHSVSANDTVPTQIAEAKALYKAGQTALAIQRVQTLLTLHPAMPALHAALGDFYFFGKEWARAQTEYERIAPPTINSLLFLGMSLRNQGKLTQALQTYAQAEKLAPKNASIFNNAGNVLNQLARFPEAIVAFELALVLDPVMLSAYTGLGNALKDSGQQEAAFALYHRFIKTFPQDPYPRCELGSILMAHQQFDDAQRCFESAMALDATAPLPYEAMGLLAAARQEDEGALAWYRRAATCERSRISPSLHVNYSNSLTRLARFAEAVVILEQGVLHAPDSALAWNNLGWALDRVNRYQEALAAYDKALALKPSYLLAECNRGLNLLRHGNWEAGWASYECRLKLEPYYQERKLPMPSWAGQSLQGKRLLIATEQGFGDAIQFLRYFPALKKMGATLILESRAEQISLFVACSFIDEVVPKSPPASVPDISADYYCYQMSLPHRFNSLSNKKFADSDWQSLPARIPDATGLLQISAERLQFWQSQIIAKSGTLKIGFAWGCSFDSPTVRQRSCVLQDLAPLFQTSNAHFYSLQKGPAELEWTARSENTRNLTNLAPLLTDFRETAAAITALDLVITIDTAVAHLAATLGKPTWILLPWFADWRWLETGETSAWYPSVRLFRQPAQGDWASVVRQVQDALAGLKQTSLL